MDAQTIVPRARPRPHEELLAVVEDDRLLLASSALLELVGYSRGEASSPEFRASYLLHTSSSRASLSQYAGPGPYEAALGSRGGAPVPCRAFDVPLELGPGRRVRALLFARPDAAGPDAAELEERALQAMVAALRAETASALLRLRKVDDRLATLGGAHVEVLRHEARSLLATRAGFLALDDAVRQLERNVRS